MDQSDKAEVEHAEEMAKPVCMCQCHAPGSKMIHCVACCGPGTPYQAPPFFEENFPAVCKCQYGGFPWNEHAPDCPEIKKLALENESKSEWNKLTEYINGNPKFNNRPKDVSLIDVIINENKQLRAEIKDSNLLREQAQSERNSTELRLNRLHQSEVAALEGRIEELTQQAADGWKHPEEVRAYTNALESKVKALRRLNGALLTAFIENLMEYIEEDSTGARLEELRPDLEKLALGLGAKRETPS